MKKHYFIIAIFLSFLQLSTAQGLEFSFPNRALNVGDTAILQYECPVENLWSIFLYLNSNGARVVRAQNFHSNWENWASNISNNYFISEEGNFSFSINGVPGNLLSFENAVWFELVLVADRAGSLSELVSFDDGRIQEVVYMSNSEPVETTATFRFEKSSNTQHIDISEYFSLYPNPSNNYIQIRTSEEIENKIESIRILNSQGGEFLKSLPTPRINTSSLPSGIYWVEIKIESGIGVQPFFKK